VNGFDVSVHAIRRRAGRRKPFEVRWRAAGHSRSKSFTTRKLADSYRAELVRAARMGLEFDPLTGEPADTADRTLRCIAGRPGRPRRDSRAHRRRTMSGCQRKIVPGVTISRIAARRSAGTVPASSASHARSGHVRRE
jgi:hypothetical protein